MNLLATKIKINHGNPVLLKHQRNWFL